MREEDYEVTSFTVTKTVDKPEVEAGDIVTYTLSVYNDGHLSNVNDLEINDVMPGIPAANFIDFKLDPSSTVDQTPGNVTINPSQRSAKIVSLEVGKVAKFTYRVKIPDDSPAGKVWTNTTTTTTADGTTANVDSKIIDTVKEQIGNTNRFLTQKYVEV